jgi:hypothetical protein
MYLFFTFSDWVKNPQTEDQGGESLYLNGYPVEFRRWPGLFHSRRNTMMNTKFLKIVNFLGLLVSLVFMLAPADQK